MPTDALPADRYSLVADIGGTNTRVALALGPKLQPDTIRRFRNAEHTSLAEVLARYLEEAGGVDCRAAAVAVAGPVANGYGHLTNLDWGIDEATLAETTRAETAKVLNDLQAQGHAIGHIPADRMSSVLPGAPAHPSATKLVIGVGTGFNAAPVFEVGGTRLVPPAEAGHVTQPVRSEADMRLVQNVEARTGFASVEELLSGRGLEHVYAWIAEETGAQQDLHAADIAKAAAESPGAARDAMIYAGRLLGIVAGNLSLVYLPFGGVFLVGGVARALGPYLSEGFAAGFRDKGRFTDFMDAFPVAIVDDDYAALTGTAGFLDRLATHSGSL
ncbi:MAG: glucokinase [Pseudomonadota bacterium]